MEGTLSRAEAIRQPGMFLSQPPMVIRPSMRSPNVTSSMESAMTSRLTNEVFMPSVPMEMPSLTVMVAELEGHAVGQSHSFLGRHGETVKVGRCRE